MGLVVGIDDYQIPGNNLHGCVADAYDFNDVSTSRFSFQNNKLLCNTDATKNNILSALGDMIAKAQKGDELFYYHSSHGTQVNLPRSGVLDDVLVTNDFDWDDFNHIMTGAEIGAVLAQLKQGVNMTVIVDACHSGTATREFNPHIRTKRCLAIPAHIAEQRKGMFFTRQRSLNRDIIKNQPYLLLSGCKDDQTSEELQLGEQVRGIFTYTLTKYLRKDTVSNWTGVYNEVCAEMQQGGYDQMPQMNGNLYANRKPFSNAI